MTAAELFEKNIERCNSLIALHKLAIPRGRQAAHGEPADILRAAIVLGVASMDSYLHKRIVEVVEDAISRHQKISRKCADIVANQFKQETRNYDLLSFLASQKPHKELAKLVKKSIVQLTFQNPEELSKAFDIMGVGEAWTKINRTLSRGRGRSSKGRFNESKKFIREFVERRNDIVHEGDMYLGRRSHSKLKPIARSYVQRMINKLHRFIKSVGNLK